MSILWTATTIGYTIQSPNQPRTYEVCRETHYPGQSSYDFITIEEVQYRNDQERQSWRSNTTHNFGWKQDSVSYNNNQPYQQ